MLNDIPPAIGSNFNPSQTRNQGGGYHNTVIAVGLHGTNKVNPDFEIEQHVVLVCNHRTDKDRTWSTSYTIYVAEHVFGGENGDEPTDKWKVLYEQQFDNLPEAVNGKQHEHARWATEAEKREPTPWIPGFTDCLQK